VTLVIDKPDWRIRYRLDGEARIPAELAKELVEVQLLPVGSKLFWTHDRIEKFISDVAEKSKQTRAHLCFQAADPQLWAATLIGIGLANWELGTRTEGLAIACYLSAAVKAYRQALEVYTREQLPQDWAMTQNNLGTALQNQGIRTGGEAGTRLLAEAVTAYRHALEVCTCDTLPLQ
jgi:tetratricopeptide (TPR) repeat protein